MPLQDRATLTRAASRVLASLTLAAALATSALAAPTPVPGVITFEREMTFGVYESFGAQFAVVADFDGDGRPDLAWNGDDEGLTVRLNDAEHAFARRVVTAGIWASEPLAAGDFDEDGRCDLVSGTRLWRGSGDGSFAAPETLLASPLAQASELLRGDLDADGHLDLAFTTQDDWGTPPHLVVMWGHGDGTFEATEPLADPTAGARLTDALDLTGDGRLELVAQRAVGPAWFDTTDRADTIVVFPQVSPRAFGPAVVTSVNGMTGSAVFADFDHDGQTEALCGDRLHHGIEACAFDTAGVPLLVFGAPSLGSTDLVPAVGDVDRDGWPDLLLRDREHLLVLHNAYGIGFQLVGSHATHGIPYFGEGMRVEDLDEDGLGDVVVHPHSSVAPGSGQWVEGLAVFFGRPGGRLAAPLWTQPPGTASVTWSHGVRLAQDGPADIVLMGSDVLTLVPHGEGLPYSTSIALGRGTPIAVRDLDGDGIDDLVSQRGDSIDVRLGLPPHAFAAPLLVGIGKVLAIGDIDGTAGLDLAVREASGAVSLRSGDGHGGFAPPLPLGLPAGIVPAWGAPADAGDLDGDGLADLVVAQYDFRGWRALFTFRSHGLAPMTAIDSLEFDNDAERLSASMTRVELADLDRDGDLDVIVLDAGGYDFGGFHVFTNDGSGRLAHRGVYPVGPDMGDMAIGDLDGDGVLDLAVNWLSQSVIGELTTYRGLGDATFERSGGMADEWYHYRPPAIGHFDEDDRLDLACATGYTYGLTVLHNISLPGTLTPVSAALASAALVDGVARIVWATDAAPGTIATVQRAVDIGAWSDVARVPPDGDGRVRFDDAGITPGHRYGYRIAFDERGTPIATAEVWLDAPLAHALSLAGAAPNPASGELMVSFSLAQRGPATLSLFDLAGRRVATRDLASFGPGAHRVRLAARGEVAPGLYFIRLLTPERTLQARAVVVR